jgi:hypothetical protein
MLKVIFSRFPISARKQVPRDGIKLVRQQEEKLLRGFVTDQPKPRRLS